ncbi:hypothetical protein CC1G_04568 [Coprinopsis cinerea okayama7|uniref:DUF1168 domain-containing protein n=1 Tax=Coprinopsis cinerea (strain Okayama-7 / 130 / ATCC MYA-4618 / FGSC 9003) TaxID=240176 RepID=A8N5J0_COPC7|nr:hypothetical protein CC1G_04568 [Coprinopsis cinerea okayama7\|eukprot:XP_001830135.1 hypothetical protein CC1G_04568 [Coprinopsis cinerea okayama7\
MTSPSPGPSSAPGTATYKHALTPVEKQRSQLERLLKDPAKPAYIPPPPKEKTIRPAREMMKNVQGSSAGAGSGEFHVYKAARRREYERLKLLEEEAQKEAIAAEFERKRKEAEEAANAKTAKNRAKRQKKKERAKGAANKEKEASGSGDEAKAVDDGSSAPLKKRRLVNGKELVFKRPGEESGSEDEGEEVGPQAPPQPQVQEPEPAPIPIVETPRITIIEDD